MLRLSLFSFVFCSNVASCILDGEMIVFDTNDNVCMYVSLSCAITSSEWWSGFLSLNDFWRRNLQEHIRDMWFVVGRNLQWSIEGRGWSNFSGQQDNGSFSRGWTPFPPFRPPFRPHFSPSLLLPSPSPLFPSPVTLSPLIPLSPLPTSPFPPSPPLPLSPSPLFPSSEATATEEVQNHVNN